MITTNKVNYIELVIDETTYWHNSEKIDQVIDQSGIKCAKLGYQNRDNGVIVWLIPATVFADLIQNLTNQIAAVCLETA